MSNGRLELGVGLGWQQEEYEASGIAFENRAKIFWETLDICKLLWEGGPVSYQGEMFEFNDIWCQPKPAQGRDIPLLFGVKMTESNALKIAKVGHGWIPIKTSRDFISEGRAMLEKAFQEEGRQDKPRIRGQLPTCLDSNGVPSVDLTLKELEKSMDAGLGEIEVFPINFAQSPEHLREVLELIAELKK